MLTKTVFSSAALLIAALSAHANAEIYKWVDAKGVTHYSDNKLEAPDDHQRVDPALPPLHLIEEPDPALSRVQAKAARERRKTQRKATVARRRSSSYRSPCDSYQQQLDKVQARLRRGYREPGGNALRERRRSIQAKINAECR